MNRSRPDILVIMTDQMRADCLSSSGHPVVQTPVIDQLAFEGVGFSRAYTHCASCIASRRSLLTGLWPASHGMVGYRDGVPCTATTVTELLSDNGYATALVGRDMHQFPASNPFGFQKRILGSVHTDTDDYAATLARALPDSGGIRGLGMSFNGWHARPWPWPEELHPVHWTVERARDLLRRTEGSSPLFLTVSFYAPHPPLIPPRFYMDRYLSMELPPPSTGNWERRPPGPCGAGGVDAHRVALSPEALRRAHAGYYGLIDYIDDNLYFLLREFRLRSESRNRPWLILFLSDHGDLMGDHYLWRKCEPYEGSSRIPLLVQGSRNLGLSRGARVDQVVGIADIMPTLLDLAGIAIPEWVEARSLVPLLRGSREAVHEYVHGEHAPCPNETEGYHMVTDGATKYIWRPADGGEQLFDLREDPGETEDRARDEAYVETVSTWRHVLVRHLAGRPEGFTDGETLVPGRRYGPVPGH